MHVHVRAVHAIFQMSLQSPAAAGKSASLRGGSARPQLVFAYSGCIFSDRTFGEGALRAALLPRKLADLLAAARECLELRQTFAKMHVHAHAHACACT